MFHVVLVHPNIPPNTGNVIRLCANTGAILHLVEPLGFPLDDAKMRRAGLDYHEFADIHVHESWDDCLAYLPSHRFFAVSTKGQTRYDQITYRADDVFVFGSETAGLPEGVWSFFKPEQCVFLPMRKSSRCLNLSNAVSVIVFEAWRQQCFSS